MTTLASAPLTTFRHDAPIYAAQFRYESPGPSLPVGRRRFAGPGRPLRSGQTNAFNWLTPAHTDAVNCVALDGDTVLSGGKDKRLKAFNRSTGKETQNKAVHTGPVIGVGYLSANGFYSLGEDSTLVRWSKTDYQPVERYDYPSKPTAATFTGGQLYVATDDPVSTWVYNSDGLLLRWLEHPPAEGKITHYLVDPSGQYLITGRITGKKTVKLKIMGEDMGSEERISPFSSFQFWETGRGIFRGSLAHSHPLSGAHVSATGNTIFTQDPKRTMSWRFGDDAATTATRLMETGYFIAPRFAGMDFTADSSILATRVGVSIFMYDTVHNLLWKTLHTPGGPIALSPAGTRMATSDVKTRLWDLANLSMIRDDTHPCAGLDFKGEDNFLGAIHDDKHIGIWNKSGLMAQGVSTLHMPLKIYVSPAGNRMVAITEEVQADMFEEKHDYYLETYEVSDLTKEPTLVNSIYILTSSKDMLFGGGEDIGFSTAISEDGSLAMVGPSGNRPVKLINMNDGTTIHEFMPPIGKSDANIGAAAVDFLAGDNGVMIGWAEGYAELWRRVAPRQLTISLDALEDRTQPSTAALPQAARRIASSVDNPAPIKVKPGQILRIEALAAYSNGDQMNVTPSSAFKISPAGAVFVSGSLLTVSPLATARLVTLTGEYEELGVKLQAQLTLEITGQPFSISGLSRANYTTDLLEPGKLVFGDAAYKFAGAIPSDCLHQIYIKGRNADRDVVATDFLSFTLNQPATVIVAVDEKMTTIPAWLKSWTVRTQPLGTDDPHPGRILYQKYFGKGKVTLGSNRDSTMPTGNSLYTVVITNADIGQTGTLGIKVNTPGAKWSLENPYGQKIDDNGTTTLLKVPTGSYLITWKPIVGWDPPTPSQASLVLSRDQVTTFTAVYIRQRGTVVIQVKPETAGWTLTDGDGNKTNGTGSRTLQGVSTGSISLAWNTLDGYDSPAQPAVKTLEPNGTVSFTGIYLNKTDNVQRSVDQILRYLLGLETSTWGLDANADGTITITDAIYLVEHALPPAPTVVSPADQATNVTLKPKLDWSDSRYAKTYDLYLWKSGEAQPSTPTVANLTASQYQVPASLAYNTYYYWRVVAKSQFQQSSNYYATFKTKEQPVQVISPNGGEYWQTGSTFNVRWKNVLSVAGPTVRIELWRVGGTKAAAVLAAKVNNLVGGEIDTSVTVPATLAEAENYKVRVISTKLETAKSSEAWDESDGTITIIKP